MSLSLRRKKDVGLECPTGDGGDVPSDGRCLRGRSGELSQPDLMFHGVDGLYPSHAVQFSWVISVIRSRHRNRSCESESNQVATMVGVY